MVLDLLICYDANHELNLYLILSFNDYKCFVSVSTYLKSLTLEININFTIIIFIFVIITYYTLVSINYIESGALNPFPSNLKYKNKIAANMIAVMETKRHCLQLWPHLTQ